MRMLQTRRTRGFTYNPLIPLDYLKVQLMPLSSPHTQIAAQNGPEASRASKAAISIA